MVVPNEHKSIEMMIDTMGIDSNEYEDDLDADEQNLEEEAQRMMLSWDRNNLLKEVEEDRANAGENEEDALYYSGDESFEDLKSDMRALEGNFVWIKVIDKKPKGKEIIASNTVLFDCIGFLEYNPEPFESTIHQGKPKIVNLAGNDSFIIAGLLQGLLSLRQGERANILIHPAMGFKSGGFPIIPGDSYLYYCVKIHQVWEEGNFDGMLQYERQMHVLIPLREKLELASEHKDVANQYLTDDKPREALVRYKAAIKWLIDTPQEEREKSAECRHLENILWQNISITMNKLGMHKSATKAAKQALAMNPTNIKALYQLARARIALGDHNRALLILEKAERVAPKNPSISLLRSQIDTNLRVEKQKREEIMLRMAKSLV